MKYWARFSELNEYGALMGVKDKYFEADTMEEAQEIASTIEKEESSKKRDLMLDWIEEDE